MSVPDDVGVDGEPAEVLRLRGPQDLALLRAQMDRYLAEAAGERVIIGIVGEPGAGKSTLARQLLEMMDGEAALVPMDGFHLANRVLEQTGARGRKGAPDTFDAEGFARLVERLRHQTEEVVYAPEFLREVDEPIAGAIAVHRSTRLVILEGNYLLLDEPPWPRVRRCLDAAWYVAVDDDVRVARLTDRHHSFGLPKQEAWNWARTQDEGNARLVRQTRDRASLVVVVP